MCLKTKTYLSKIAQEDIVCYKLLRRTEGVNKFIYHTPFQNKIFHLDNNNVFKAIGLQCTRDASSYDAIYGYRVDIGYIHTMKEEKDALHLAVTASNDDWDIISVKCIIPKGTIYHEGSFDGYPAYASGLIKVVDKLN